MRDDACPYCASPLVVFDMPRLMSSLLIRDAIAVPAEHAQHVAWACRACGSAVDPTRMTQCPQCSHTVVAPQLHDVARMLDAIEPVLRSHQAHAPRPHGAWARRLTHRDTGLYRVVTHYLSRLSDTGEEESVRGAGVPWLLVGALVLLWWWLRK